MDRFESFIENSLKEFKLASSNVTEHFNNAPNGFEMKTKLLIYIFFLSKPFSARNCFLISQTKKIVIIFDSANYRMRDKPIDYRA